MSSALVTTTAGEIMESVIVRGDLALLQPEERARYYSTVCSSVGLNPLTKPFEYITLNGKLTLYARKDATDQLRSLRGVSVTIVSRERVDDVYVVTARATMPDGRVDESIGAVFLGKVTGEALANALMKTETKAKRRVTLSICGLGMLDETEVETIPAAISAPAPAPAQIAPVAMATEEQVESLKNILNGLLEYGIEDDKIRAAVLNIAKVELPQNDRNPLAVLTGGQAETLITRLGARLQQLDEEAQVTPTVLVGFSSAKRPVRLQQLDEEARATPAPLSDDAGPEF